MKTIQIFNKACKQILVVLLLSIITFTVNAQVCTSTKDYETGLKNGLKMAPPCELTNTSKLQKCVGDYSPTTWSTCYGERTAANGGTYRGGYLEGKAHGKGEFVNPDGSRYLGDYVKGQRNGYGKEYSATGAIVKAGQWSNGAFAGATQEAQEKTATSPSRLTTNNEVLTCTFTEFKTPSTGGYQPYNGNATRVEFNDSRLMFAAGKMLYTAVNGAIGVSGPGGSLAYTYKGDSGAVVTMFKMPNGGVNIAMRSDTFSYVGLCR